MPSSSRIADALVRPLQAFLKTETASGVALLASTAVAIVWANVDPESYQKIFGETVRAFVNDGLMTLFFFLVGLEIKRELVSGELDTVAKASLPAVAAVGGMVVPAAIFFALNRGGPGQAGWGIPMATDIAFCVGLLSLLRGRVPPALVAFLTALAIFDDIGGILVIAIFYGARLDALWLLAAGGVTFVLYLMNRRSVSRGWPYAAVGIGLWFALHHGGIHATLAGVIVGVMVPARPCGKSQGPCQDLIQMLHPWVAFVVMPLFPLANAGITLGDISGLVSPVALGTALGLFVGKQIGIFGFTLAAVRLRLAPMPEGATAAKLYGVAVVAGIGFTVALFIAGLAYPGSAELLDEAKLGILAGSLVSGALGFTILRLASGAPRSTALPEGS